MKHLLMILPALAACSQAPQVLALEKSLAVEPPGTMAITGTATLEIAPDCADLTMTLTVDGAKPSIAASGVQRRQLDLVAALGKLGVETPDIKLSYLTLDPVYEPNPTYAQVVVHHYRASITVTATTKSFGKIGAIMEAGADAGATSQASAFRRSDLATLKKQVRDLALGAAKDKARQTATALDLTLGKIVAVAENVGATWNGYAPQVSNAVGVRDTGGVALGGTLQPLTLDVTVTYQLR